MAGGGLLRSALKSMTGPTGKRIGLAGLGGAGAWTAADAMRTAQEGQFGRQQWWDRTRGRNALADQYARGRSDATNGMFGNEATLPPGAKNPGRSSMLGRFLTRPWATMTGATQYDPGHDLLGPDSNAAQAKQLGGQIDRIRAERAMAQARSAYAAAGIPFPAEQPASGSSPGAPLTGGGSPLLALAGLAGAASRPGGSTGGWGSFLSGLRQAVGGSGASTPTAAPAPAPATGPRKPSAFHAGPHNYINGGPQSNHRGAPALPWDTEQPAAPIDDEERRLARLRELARVFGAY